MAREGGQWWRHPVLVDALLFAGLTAAVSVAIAVSHEGNSRTPDTLGYGIGVAMAALVFARRRWPRTVLLATTALMFAYHALDYPGIEPALPLSVALATAAHRLRLWWAVSVAAVFVVAQILARRMDVLEVLDDVARDAALLIAVILLGLTIRNAEERRQRERAELHEQAERRAAEERLQIAQDVHDIVGHTVAAMTVQAGLAADVLDRDPEQSREALRSIRAAGRDALAELRSTVGLLRSGTPTGPRGLDDLEDLLGGVRAAGIEATVERTGRERAVPAMISTTGFRIVQEALTNVLKHADAQRVGVTLDFGPEMLSIDVTDDGEGQSPASNNGFGLAGMVQRAESVGGRLEYGLAGGTGFRVRAELPLGETT